LRLSLSLRARWRAWAPGLRS